MSNWSLEVSSTKENNKRSKYWRLISKKTKYSPFSIFFRLKCQRRCRLQKKTRSKHRRLSGKKLNTYLFRSKCRTGGAVSFYLIIKKGKAFLVKKRLIINIINLFWDILDCSKHLEQRKILWNDVLYQL